MSKLVHIADRVLNRPLMVLPEKLALIAQVLDGRIGIDATDLAQAEADHLRSAPDASRFVGQYEQSDPSDPKSRKPYRTTDRGVAVIPVLGSLVNRGGWVGAYSGMTSYEGLKHQLNTAAADASVASIILDMDSPGGEAVGAFEAGDAVREAAKTKPVVAVVNGMAASAAYAIASAATRIITTASGVSGSIGVVMLHADYSHALHERGVKPTLIHAGARKVDGNPYQPLTDDVKAELKAEIDRFYDLFVASVSAGRNGRMGEAAIRATEARTYIGADAVKVGLADSVGSFETVLAELSSKAPKTVPPAKRQAAHGGLHLDAPGPAPSASADAPKPQGLRSPEDCALIERAAGGDARLAKLVSTLNGFEYERCGQTDAIIIVELSLKQLQEGDARAERARGSLHPSGLYLGELRVDGGPLFAPPDAGPAPAAADNHGWDDVVAKLNKKLS